MNLVNTVYCASATIIKGVTLASKRLTKCHPIKFLGGSEGYDPVPKKMKERILQSSIYTVCLRMWSRP